MSHLLALDLGCTKALVGVADAAGTILARRRIDTLVAEGAERAMARVAAALVEACAEVGLDPAGAAALGIGAPGPLDRARGVLLDPPQMPWGEAPVVELLLAALGVEDLPWRLDNDCKVGGLGELWRGAATGASSMVYFGVGTGVGGCIVLDGEPWHGVSDNAAELGHLTVWMDGPECGCGALGCLEGIASGSGIERRARRAITAGRATSLAHHGDNVRGADVAAAAAAGDELAIELLEDAATALGVAVGSMVNAFSPEVVVIGGGMAARGGGAWLDDVANRARAASFGPNRDASRIVGPALGEESVLHGAVHLATHAAAQAPPRAGVLVTLQQASARIGQPESYFSLHRGRFEDHARIPFPPPVRSVAGKDVWTFESLAAWDEARRARDPVRRGTEG
ncbi:MAG: transcriptional regulator [Thermoleophilia bacterium]|nr:transcriptional regulator [Thermoleophilia bacterium]